MQRRNTSQRQIVYEALDLLGHASSESLIEYIRTHYHNISLATIYRNIAILMDEQKVKKVKLHNEDVYETIKQDHFHFVCKRCGMIYDVDAKQFHKALELMKQLKEMDIEECDISLYGTCQNCKKKENEENEKICM